MPLCTLSEYPRITGPEVGHRQAATFSPVKVSAPDFCLDAASPCCAAGVGAATATCCAADAVGWAGTSGAGDPGVAGGAMEAGLVVGSCIAGVMVAC